MLKNRYYNKSNRKTVFDLQQSTKPTLNQEL